MTGLNSPFDFDASDSYLTGLVSLYFYDDFIAFVHVDRIWDELGAALGLGQGAMELRE